MKLTSMILLACCLGFAAPVPLKLRIKTATQAAASVEVLKDIEYAANGISLKLDLYLPTAKEPVPVIVFVHGGGWKTE